jgi:hypothetical protein
MSFTTKIRGLLICVASGVSGCLPDGYRYLVPEGYVGWVQIRFEIEGAPPLPREGRFRVARFPASGILETSEGPLGGDAPSSWSYEDSAGHRRPAPTGSAFSQGDAAIRGSTSSYSFIGTHEQNERIGKKLDRANGPIVGPVVDR